MSINNKFNTQGTFDYQIFLTENSRMSESMFMILSELNLVTLDGTFISEVKFQKTDITSSALYKQLQNERKSLEEIYLDNMRCTRAEILHR